MYFYVKKEGKGKEREKYFIVNIRFLLNSILSILLNIRHCMLVIL